MHRQGTATVPRKRCNNLLIPNVSYRAATARCLGQAGPVLKSPLWTVAWTAGKGRRGGCAAAANTGGIGEGGRGRRGLRSVIDHHCGDGDCGERGAGLAGCSELIRLTARCSSSGGPPRSFQSCTARSRVFEMAGPFYTRRAARSFVTVASPARTPGEPCSTSR